MICYVELIKSYYCCVCMCVSIGKWWESKNIPLIVGKFRTSSENSNAGIEYSINLIGIHFYKH